MKKQATKMTQGQLRYLKHWAKLGYQYTPGDAVPEDISIRPPALERAGYKELIFSFVLLVTVVAIFWGAQ